MSFNFSILSFPIVLDQIIQTEHIYQLKILFDLCYSNISALTKHDDECHLDRLDFCLRDESPRAGSPAVVIAVQSDFPSSGLS